MNTQPSLRFYLLITALCSIGLVSSDMFLPSLPAMSAYFHAAPAQAQLALSVFLLGLSLFQVVFGALSDTFGRRKVLLTGLTIYAVSTLGCALAPSFTWLLVSRFFQAAGACAGLVLGRAIVADRHGPVGGALVLSVVFPFVAMSPAVAPIAGGYLETAFGWRGSFVVLSAYSLALLGAVVFLRDVKRPQTGTIRISERIDAMWWMLKSPAFVGYVAAIGGAYGAYFGYITASPFLLAKLGADAVTTGYMYIPLSLPYVLAALIGRRLAKRWPLTSLVRVGLILGVLGTSLLGIVALSGMTLTLPLLFIPLATLTAGNGLVLPFASAGAVALYPDRAGVASGLIGTVQLGAAAGVAFLVSAVGHGELLRVAMLLLAATGIAGMTFMLAEKKRGLVHKSGAGLVIKAQMADAHRL